MVELDEIDVDRIAQHGMFHDDVDEMVQIDEKSLFHIKKCWMRVALMWEDDVDDWVDILMHAWVDVERHHLENQVELDERRDGLCLIKYEKMKSPILFSEIMFWMKVLILHEVIQHKNQHQAQADKKQL